jgi:hypothetical protein
MDIFVFWVIMALVIGLVANSRGFSGFGWFLFGLIIWPLALIHLLMAKPNTKVVEAQQLTTAPARSVRFAPS